jgi:dienelactone hydrolase
MPYDNVKYASGTKQIPGWLYSPSGTASTGLVVIAYGVDGLTDNHNGPWKTMIQGYAEALAKGGLFALIPDYLVKTNTTGGIAAMEVMMQKRDDWATAVSDCASHAKTLARRDATRIGLLGFSLGGHLCLRIRANVKPKALVEYFAPVLDGIGPSGAVPRAQIHHGTSDMLPATHFSFAGAIRRAWRRNIPTLRSFLMTKPATVLQRMMKQIRRQVHCPEPGHCRFLRVTFDRRRTPDCVALSTH